MRKFVYIFLILIFLTGCGNVSDESLVFSDSVCPNENATEKVFYDIKVVRVDEGLKVEARSNFKLFKNMDYIVNCNKDVDDISVKWLTFMGSENYSDKDQIAKALVTIKDGNEIISEKMINFVSNAVTEIVD